MSEVSLYFFAEQLAPAPRLAHPDGCAALSIGLVTVPLVSRSCEHFPDGFDIHILPALATKPPEPFDFWDVPARIMQGSISHTLFGGA